MVARRMRAVKRVRRVHRIQSVVHVTRAATRTSIARVGVWVESDAESQWKSGRRAQRCRFRSTETMGSAHSNVRQSSRHANQGERTEKNVTRGDACEYDRAKQRLHASAILTRVSSCVRMLHDFKGCGFVQLHWRSLFEPLFRLPEQVQVADGRSDAMYNKVKQDTYEFMRVCPLERPAG
jgi:hypothetical protein